MSKPLRFVSAAHLAAVTGGAVKKQPPAVEPNPFADPGTPGACEFLKTEVPGRKDLIASDAVQSTLRPGMRGAYNGRIFSDAVALSWEAMDQRLNCRK